MIRTFYVLLAILFFEYSSAQVKIRLNNNWEFVRQDLGGIWEAVRPVTKGNPESVPLWDSVSLPHCFNAKDAVDPDVNYYQGPGWYRTRLAVNNPYDQGRTLLHFEGAGQKTDVYVYTTKVGSHTGGYDEWTVDITDAVAAFKKDTAFAKQYKGKIPISIRCDNSRDLEMIPSDLSDFNLYGGIYRYLNLVYVPVISVERIQVIASVDTAGKVGKVDIWTQLYNPTHATVRQSPTYKIYDPSGKQLGIDDRRFFQVNENPNQGNCVIKNPQLWSPSNPVLYTIETSIRVGDSVFSHREKIGFRNFQFVTKGPFKLNGKRLLLRGTHRHEDHAAVAAAMTEDQMREEMISMKQMGVNFIRLGHYQQSRIILNLCDSLGILVWEEIPWCRGGLGGEVYKDQARRMLTNMITQHYNHPAVIIWGLGNENDWPGDFPEFDKEKIRAFMK
ncbi:MAG: glycoside hydrolase family 2 protein, partial [Flavisolibacter sp.]